jgi:hypothetical protein
MFNRDSISQFAAAYPPQLQNDVELAITEAWRWLEINMFFVPAPGINGQNGWFVLGRRGRAALEQPQQFASYAKAAALSPRLSSTLWLGKASSSRLRIRISATVG